MRLREYRRQILRVINDLVLVRDQRVIKFVNLYNMEAPSGDRHSFTIDAEAAKQYIFEKTGMVPAIYDKGTHYVTNQKLTLEILKEISESTEVLEVAGEYTGNITARGSSHVHSDDCPLRDLDYAY